MLKPFILPLSLGMCLFSSTCLYAQENTPEPSSETPSETPVVEAAAEPMVGAVDSMAVADESTSEARSIWDRTTVQSHASVVFVSRTMKEKNIPRTADIGVSDKEDRVYQAFRAPGWGLPTHDTYLLDEGFHLQQMGVRVQSAFDAFRLESNLLFRADELEVAEAAVVFTDLWDDMEIKAGKFLSRFGYHNQQHLDQWHFANQSLANVLFFGEKGFLEKGVQVRFQHHGWDWGAELLEGNNAHSFGTKGYVSQNQEVKDANAPNVRTFFIDKHWMTTSSEFHLGTSYAGGASRRIYGENDARAFSGAATRIFGVEASWTQHFADEGSFHMVLEGMQRNRKGTYDEGTQESDLNSEQSVYDLQLVYTHSPVWSLGLRYEVIGTNDSYIEGTSVGSAQFCNTSTGLSRDELLEQGITITQLCQDESGEVGFIDNSTTIRTGHTSTGNTDTDDLSRMTLAFDYHYLPNVLIRTQLMQSTVGYVDTVPVEMTEALIQTLVTF